MDEYLKKHGVDKLSKTPDGRRFLNQYREKYKKEILQPGQPGFQEAYGKQIAEREKQKRKNEDIARGMREELEWKKENEKQSMDKKKLIL